ncbi:5'/3'-nucleotidase sure [Saccharata proteae CBS 121410]|uniref:5'/3'-nucleotidase sure n=1 Tax=Saccharata proteae CBS 121410 TaxID=1314787 RepID=A0A9P4I1Z7_9PEZI|nr:5'/3'-nucleotidase sure [Saccharata proteae CBS 121410]
MRISLVSFAVTALSLAHASEALHILLNNDDGWASANIRETYRLLKQAGHQVLMVAPVVDNSGQGGRSSFSTEANLTTNGEFDSVLAGAPSLGHEPFDNHVWYYNGTPAACTFVNLDYVLPRVWPNVTAPDLLVSGPNVGQNLGSFLYTLSGTMGATYAAVGRGIPAIAFSAGSEGGQRGYKEINETTAAGLPDPATINAQLTVSFVEQLVRSTAKGQRLLPLGYGINVNLPTISSFTDSSCLSPPFIQTRLTGGADTDSAVYNETTKLFTYGDYVGAGVNACINGDCSLPGETDVADSGCMSTVSVFTVDYDAPVGNATASVQQKLFPLVKTEKMGKRDGGKKQRVERGEAWRHE